MATSHRLNSYYWVYSTSGTDLVGWGGLDECAAVAEDELEVGLREVLFDFDSSYGVLVLLSLCSFLNPVTF